MKKNKKPRTDNVEKCCLLQGLPGCTCRVQNKRPEKIQFFLDKDWVDKWVDGGAMTVAFKRCEKLSDSQLEVMKRARPPLYDTGRITNVMAAAAAGKTTTMVALNAVLHGLGHTRTMYCLFNKSKK